MARINLLPWRAEQRKQRERDFYALLAMTAVAALALLYGVYWQFNEAIAHQEARNNYLTAQIAILDRDIREIEALELEKARLLQRQEVIEQLQATRSQTVRVFDQLVDTVPEGVYLTSIRQQGRELTLEGRAQSNARVSRYMDNLNGSPWLANPDLRIAEVRGGGARGSRVSFILRVRITNPNLVDEEAGS